MRLMPSLALAGVASLALAGTAYAASRHVMHVDLPDGAVARIEYEGKVPPKVRIVPAADRAVALPVTFVDPFARMDAMFAAMAWRHARMMSEIAAMEAAATGATAPGLPFTMVSGGAPASGSFTFVSTTRGGGCGYSVRITHRPGEAPRRIERHFGDCAGAAPADAAPSATPSHAAPSPRTTV